MDDYFAGSKPPGAPPAPPAPPGAPPAPPAQPAPEWSPRGTTPPNPFGSPEPPSPWNAQPASPWNTQPASPWAAQPASGTSTTVKVLIGVGALVGVLILFAIAIPVFLDQRGKAVAGRTTVSLPATVAGQPIRTDSAAAQVVQPLRDVDAPGTHLVAAYGGVAQPDFVIMITKYFMTERDQRDYFTGVRKGAQSSAGLTLGPFSSVDPGKLGGKVECASAPLATMCVFADAGAYGLMIGFGTREHALQLLPQVRSAVEHRS